MPLHLFAGPRVRSFAEARGWYERLVGEPTFLPHATEAAWTYSNGVREAVSRDPGGHEIGVGGPPGGPPEVGGRPVAGYDTVTSALIARRSSMAA